MYDALTEGGRPPRLQVDVSDVLGFIGQIQNVQTNENVLYSMTGTGVANISAHQNVLARDWPDFFNLISHLTVDPKYVTPVDGKAPEVFIPKGKVCAYVNIPTCKLAAPGGTIAAVWFVKVMNAGWKAHPGMSPHNGHIYLTWGVDGGMNMGQFWIYLHAISLANVLRTCGYLLPVIEVRRGFRKTARSVYRWMLTFWKIQVKLGETQAYEETVFTVSKRKGEDQEFAPPADMTD